MSVLHDVLAKMMTDFLSKEDEWVTYSRASGRRRADDAGPAPFTLTLDTPEFRQLIKEMNDSRFVSLTNGGVGYKRLIIDGVPYDSPAPTDELLRARTAINVCYPSPASAYIYAARIAHNCTLAPLAAPSPPVFPDLDDWRMTPVPATGRSVPSARDRFIEENAEMRARGVPESDRPGFVLGGCTCVDCRFENYRVARGEPNAHGGIGAPTVVRANTSDGLRQQDRDRLAGMELRPAVVEEWGDAYQTITVGPGMAQWIVGPTLPEAPYPAPAPPSHPNDPRPRMPRLSDARPATAAATAETLRRIWSGRTRL